MMTIKTYAYLAVCAYITVFAIFTVGFSIWWLESIEQGVHSYTTTFYNYRQHQSNFIKTVDTTRSLNVKSEILNHNKSDEKNFTDTYGSSYNNISYKIEYGVPLKSGKRTPVVMIRKTLDKTVHRRFLEYSMFACREQDLAYVDYGLDKRVKIPFYIYEGYFHSLPTKQKIFSRNPNPLIGKDFMKPAAGEFLRAFYHAFRKVNNDILKKLTLNLIASATKRLPRNPEIDVCFEFAKWIERDLTFGDLSIQIHYGKGNNDKFSSAWHTDAENSLLHLAVTIKGSRELHSRRCEQSTCKIPDEIIEEQRDGDVYLSSSALMLHAPKFSNTSYDDRVIAIQARILYTSQEIQHFRDIRTPEGWASLTTILASVLSTSVLKIPTLIQIEESLAFIEEFTE